jgi:GyrI-like small molecule binding domain
MARRAGYRRIDGTFTRFGHVRLRRRAGWGRMAARAGAARGGGGAARGAAGRRAGRRAGAAGRRAGAGVAGGGVAVLRSGSVAYDVRAERADPRPLAAIRATTTRQQLGRDIIALLDLVWPVLREQRVRTGHNVVVYHGGTAQELTVDVGVEAFTDFAGRSSEPERLTGALEASGQHGEIRRTATPSGEVATVAHYGEYSEMAGAYAALERWCRDQGRRPAGVSWEVYGDWDDDPARRRTDVYFLLEAPAG